MSITTRRGSQIAALRFWFGLYRQAPAAVLGELYGAVQPLSSREIASLCGLSSGSIPVRISELRAAMESEAIDTVEGCYLLTEVGRQECEKAFAEMARDLMPERAATAIGTPIAA